MSESEPLPSRSGEDPTPAPVSEGAPPDNDAKIATLRENLAYYRQHAAECFKADLTYCGAEAQGEADRLDELLALRLELSRLSSENARLAAALAECDTVGKFERMLDALDETPEAARLHAQLAAGDPPMIPSDGSPPPQFFNAVAGYPDASQKADPPLADLEVERAARLLRIVAYEIAHPETAPELTDLRVEILESYAKDLRALAARLPALEAENRQLATDLAAAHAAIDRGVAQLLTLHEDAALLRAERDEALAKLAGFTAEDVECLRDRPSVYGGEGVTREREWDAFVDSLIARIAALLSPAASGSDSDQPKVSENAGKYQAGSDSEAPA